MKRLVIASLAVAIFVGCNVNESKEGRIRKLESQVKQTTERLDQFEERLQDLEAHASEKEQ